MLLSDKYPFLTNFFETAIGENSSDNKLAHSLLFYGNDIDAQYTLSLEIARLLNCDGDRSNDCQCLNCRWIREHKHPAVLTISRIDNKPDDDDSKTVISVKQAELIRNSLLTSSDFHKVFIFCDKDDEGNLKGLNRFNFQEATANSLLKSIEEPPENVTFIFLTVNRDDIISTIISRSQCFFVPQKTKDEFNYYIVENEIQNYWEMERKDAFNLSEKLCNLADSNQPLTILEQIQNYMLTVLKSNPKQQFLIKDMSFIEKSKQEILKGMKPDIVFDELCLNLIK